MLSSLAPSASTAARSNVRDDRETPLCVGRDGRIRRIDLADGERRILPVGLICRSIAAAFTADYAKANPPGLPVIARSTCDEAIHLSCGCHGLLRCARNDGPRRHCEERSDEAIHTAGAARWIASRSLSSGALARDPLARNDGGLTPTTRRGPSIRDLALRSRPVSSHGSQP
jgi:hypothetical protein